MHSSVRFSVGSTTIFAFLCCCSLFWVRYGSNGPALQIGRYFFQYVNDLYNTEAISTTDFIAKNTANLC